MKHFYLILSVAAIILFAVFPSHSSGKSEDNKYVEFLRDEGNVKNGVDYVIGLFESYDIVVLCERDHAEMLQYTELIHRIIEHPISLKMWETCLPKSERST